MVPTFYRQLPSLLQKTLPILLWVAGVYAFLQLLIWAVFSTSVWPSTWWKDYLTHLIAGGILFLLCRSFWGWAISFALLMGVLQICNALKLVILGSPMMPDDFITVRNMFHLFGGWRLIAMWLALLSPLMALCANIAWAAKRTWLVLSCVVILSLSFNYWAIPISKNMDFIFADRIWDQPGNYKDRGLLRHLLQETARNLARGKTNVSAADAITSFTELSQGLPPITPSAHIDAPRNVYLLLLESFWDPMALKNAGISQDPLDPRFRTLWQQTNFTKALSPVFGGYTANSEFEILCGFPVRVDAVFFEGWLRNDAPCLPRYLSASGYHTIAAHPNYAAFWNRVNAYQRVGFDDYWAQPDFNLDDMNREFLSDASLYRQMWNKIQPDIKNHTPILTHIVTFFGHMDYPLNETRPKLITVEHDPNLVEEYVNQIYYKSRELMDFVELLRKKDPNAVIVMYGDHLPFLGPNYDGYVQSNLLTRSKADFTPTMFYTMANTPLIIINGNKGPVKLGEVPIYELPSKILHLLGDAGNSIVNLTQQTSEQTIRPLPGITLSIPVTDDPFTCTQSDTSAQCTSVNSWIKNVSNVSDDIFGGSQYSLGK